MGLFWLLSQHRQKRSTTPKVLNRVCGSVNQGDLGVSQKPPFVERFIVAADARIIWVFQAN
jgi:hypothetical protein